MVFDSKNLKIEEQYKLYKSVFHATMGQRIIVNSTQHIITKTAGFDAFFDSKKDLTFLYLLKLLRKRVCLNILLLNT